MVQKSVMTGTLKREMAVMKIACGSVEMAMLMEIKSVMMGTLKQEMDATHYVSSNVEME